MSTAFGNQGSYNPRGGHAQAYNPLEAAMYTGKTYSSSGGNVAGGDKQDSYMEKFIPFFGQPKQAAFFDPHQEYPRENYQLPEAFRGSRVYMSKLLINMIRRQDVWPITDMLPWQKWEGGMTIAWDVWQFHDGHLGRTPEEAVSRLLTSNFRENRTYIVRWGLAMLLEHGFMNTERGRQSYRMGKWQIANATVETLCHGAMIAVLNPNKERFPNMRSSGMSTNSQRDKLLKTEVANWGIVHKDENGTVMMLDRLRQNLRANSSTRVEGNLTVFPQGMPKFIQNRPENRYFFLSGRRSANRADNIPGSVESVVRESRGFRIEHNKEAVDPMFQQRTIGTMFNLTDRHLRSIPANEYRTHMMDTFIYTESLDDWVRISYEQAVLQTGLFHLDKDVDKWLLTEHGERFFHETPYWGDYLVNHDIMDRFLEFLYHGVDARRFADFFSRFVEAYKDVVVDRDLATSASDFEQEVRDRATAHPASPFAKGNALIDKDLLDEFVLILGGNIGNGAPFGAAQGAAGNDTADLKTLRQRVAANSEQAKLFVSWIGQKGIKVAKASQVKINDDGADLKLSNSIVDTLKAIGKAELRGPAPAAGTSAASIEHAAKIVFTEAATKMDLKELIVACFDDEGSSAVDAQGLGMSKDETAELLARSVAHDQILVVGFHANSAANVLAAATKYIGAVDAGVKKLIEAKTFGDAERKVASVVQNRLFQHLYTSIRLTPELHDGIDRTQMLAALKWYDVQFADASDRSASVKPWPAGASTELKAVSRYDLKSPGKPKLHRLSVHLHALVLGAFSELSSGKFPAAVRPITWGAKDAFEAAFGPASSISSVPNFAGHMQVSGHLVEEEKKRRLRIRRLAEDIGMDPEDRDALESHHRAGAMDQYKRYLTAAPRLYASAPGAMEAIYRRRVLATAIVSAATDLANRALPAEWSRASMTNTEFVRLMALVESLIPAQPELVVPKNTAEEQRKEAERVRLLNTHSDARVQLLLSEIYHGNKLVDILGTLKSGYPSLWKSQVNLKDWVQQAIASKAQESLRKTGDILVVAMKRMGQKYFTDFSARLMNGAMKVFVAERAALSQSGSGVATSASFSDAREAMETVKNAGQMPGSGARAVVTDADLAAFRDTVGRDQMRQALHALPIDNAELIRWCLRNNMPALLGILGLRPHCTYIMGAVVHMEAFGAAGYTLQGHHDFQLGDDVQQKMHFGHFTLYAKSVVMDETLIAHAQDVFYKDYVGGNDHSVWDPTDQNHVSDYREGFMEHSIFMCALAPSEYIEVSYLDITGRFHAELGGTPSRTQQFHYSSAPLYCDMWGWRHGQYLLNRPYFDYAHRPQVNTLVFQDHQWLYVHKSTERGGWSHPVINKGHFGERIYPGCGRTRNGLSMYLQPTKYADTSTIALMV